MCAPAKLLAHGFSLPDYDANQYDQATTAEKHKSRPGQRV